MGVVSFLPIIGAILQYQTFLPPIKLWKTLERKLLKTAFVWARVAELAAVIVISVVMGSNLQGESNDGWLYLAPTLSIMGVLNLFASGFDSLYVFFVSNGFT